MNWKNCIMFLNRGGKGRRKNIMKKTKKILLSKKKTITKKTKKKITKQKKDIYEKNKEKIAKQQKGYKEANKDEAAKLTGRNTKIKSMKKNKNHYEKK